MTLLAPLMSDQEQQATVDRHRGVLQDKLGRPYALPTPEAMGVTAGVAM